MPATAQITARSLTWYVSVEGRKQRALCLQAASPKRLRSFIIRRPNHFVIEQPFPLDAEGREMDEDSRRRLLRQLQRNAEVPTAGSASETLKLAATIEQIVATVCRRHRIRREDIERAGHHAEIARARLELAHILNGTLRLPKSEIAAVLKLKHQSSVAYLLRQPRPPFLQEIP